MLFLKKKTAETGNRKNEKVFSGIEFVDKSDILRFVFKLSFASSSCLSLTAQNITFFEKLRITTTGCLMYRQN